MKKILTTVVFVAMVGSASAQPIVTDSTSRSFTENNSTTTVKSPPPTAVAPAITTINNDVCAVAASGAVQTQILGISMGGTQRDLNCERIKLSKNLFDMGMKVAAVATLCQDERVFSAMIAAGTPCPVEGKIGEQAKAEWQARGVLDKANKAEVGNYATRPVVVDRTPTPVSMLAPVPTPSLQVESAKPANTGCDYTGSDPVVMARVCGK
jgi:hypothetical protein